MEGFTGEVTTTQQPKPQPKPKSAEAREGFNMIDRESTIQKGKRSNEVPVFASSRNQGENVEATDKGVFKDSYTAL